MQRRSRARVIDSVNQLPNDDEGLGAERTYHINELDDAKSALTALVLGDKRLRLGQALGDLRLSQAAAFAEVPQEGTQLLLTRRAQGVAHDGRPRSNTSASAHNPSSGVSHFGIMLGSCARNAQSGGNRGRGEDVR
jgi:hypothetical protein